jgi:sigma-B regulation protein RsbU (phosphoserine phosphatase)
MEGSTANRASTGEAPQSLTNLAFLSEAATELSSTLELEAVFEKIADRIRPILDYQLFCVMMWNEDTELLEHSFSLRFGEHMEQKGGFPLGHGISGTVAAERRPIRVADVQGDPRYVRSRHPEVEVRSELAVPLLYKGRLVGVLDLESTELDYFTQEHEHLVTTLASYMANALENARLYNRVRAEEHRLEEDLATAREIQKGLLPAGAPRMPGIDIGVVYEPARELAGDFYDFLPCGDGRLALVVGDVAGKATPAALYGSLAIGLLRGHVLKRASGTPSDILRHVNDQLRLPRIRNRFLALILAVYDHQDRSLPLANAGVPWPYLIRGGDARKIEVQGLPLGLLADVQYEESRVILRPGDIVVLCSDGLHDAENEHQEQFGDALMSERLIALSGEPAQVIAQELVRSGQRHAGMNSSHASDDCTVVVLKVTRR